MASPSSVSFFRIALIASVAITVLLFCVYKGWPFEPETAQGRVFQAAGFLYLWLALLVYIDERSRAAGNVGEKRSVSDQKYVISDVAFLLAVFGPMLMASISEIRLVLDPSFSEICRAALWVCLAVTLGSLVWPVFENAEKGEPIPSLLWIPISTGSFIIWLGGREGFGYLRQIIADEILNLVSVARWQVVITLSAIVATLFVFEFVRRVFIDRSDFSAILSEWRVKQETSFESLDELSFFQQLGKLAEAIASLFVVFLRMIGTAFLVLISTLDSSIRAILDRRRAGLSIILAGLIWLGILVQALSDEFLQVLSLSYSTAAYDLRLTLFGTGAFLWMGILIIAHSRLCYRTSRGIVVGYPFVASTLIGVVWLLAAALHFAAYMRWIDAPGFDFNARDYLLILVPIILLIILGAQFRGTRWLWWISAGVAAVIWTYFLLTRPAPLSASPPPIPELRANSATTPERVTVPIESPAALDDHTWVYGSWGVDDSCSDVVRISGDAGYLDVEFDGTPVHQRITHSAPELVATEEWTFTRVGGSIRAQNNGNDVGELSACNR